MECLDAEGEKKRTPVEKTPAKKRKAYAELNPTPNMRKADSKKVKTTYTPKTQSRQLRKTTASSSASAISGRMNENAEEGVVRRSKLKGYFDELGKSLGSSLTASLTNYFTKAVGLLGERVNKNANNIEEMKESFRRMERDFAASESKVDMKLERIESSFLTAKSSGRLSDGKHHEDRPRSTSVGNVPDMRIDTKAREQNMMNHERYKIARRSVRLWPVAGTSDEEIRTNMLRFIREKINISEEACPGDAIKVIRRSI